MEDLINDSEVTEANNEVNSAGEDVAAAQQAYDENTEDASAKEALDKAIEAKDSLSKNLLKIVMEKSGTTEEQSNAFIDMIQSIKDPESLQSFLKKGVDTSTPEGRAISDMSTRIQKIAADVSKKISKTTGSIERYNKATTDVKAAIDSIDKDSTPDEFDAATKKIYDSLNDYEKNASPEEKTAAEADGKSTKWKILAEVIGAMTTIAGVITALYFIAKAMSGCYQYEGGSMPTPGQTKLACPTSKTDCDCGKISPDMKTVKDACADNANSNAPFCCGSGATSLCTANETGNNYVYYGWKTVSIFDVISDLINDAINAGKDAAGIFGDIMKYFKWILLGVLIIVTCMILLKIWHYVEK
jgi:hypothetical protein